MNDRDLLKQALEALDWAADCIEPRKPHNCDCPICVASDALLQRLADNTIHSCSYYCERPDCVRAQRDELRERLAQPEPVATVESKTGNPDILMSWWHEPALPVGTKLYTTPPRREWVGLTLEEIGLLTTGDGWSHLETPALALFARAIEAKLKEKNA